MESSSALGGPGVPSGMQANGPRLCSCRCHLLRPQPPSSPSHPPPAGLEALPLQRARPWQPSARLQQQGSSLGHQHWRCWSSSQCLWMLLCQMGSPRSWSSMRTGERRACWHGPARMCFCPGEQTVGYMRTRSRACTVRSACEPLAVRVVDVEQGAKAVACPAAPHAPSGMWTRGTSPSTHTPAHWSQV